MTGVSVGGVELPCSLYLPPPFIEWSCLLRDNALLQQAIRVLCPLSDSSLSLDASLPAMQTIDQQREKEVCREVCVRLIG